MTVQSRRQLLLIKRTEEHGAKQLWSIEENRREERRREQRADN